MTDSTFEENESVGEGGVIRAHSKNTNIIVSGSVFIANRAIKGGVAYLRSSAKI